MMNVPEIFQFLSELKQNNNREWFASNRERYEESKKAVEAITEELIARISEFDDQMRMVTAKDCIFRIYRDTRFHDKTPYKIHWGTYIAPHGGRKSEHGGYYLHLQPNESFISPGIWNPMPDILKELRKAIYDNYDEFLEIVQDPKFQEYYGNSFYEEAMLKTTPKGFPRDSECDYFLRLKHYLVSKNLPDKFFASNDYMDKLVEMFRVAYPLNKFLNFTVDELRNY